MTKQFGLELNAKAALWWLLCIYLDDAFENRILLYHAGEWKKSLQSVSLTCTQLICLWKGIVTAQISFFFSFNSHPASWIAFSNRPVKERRVAMKRVTSKAISRNGKWHLNGEAFWRIMGGSNAQECKPTSHSNNCSTEYLRDSISSLNWYFWEDMSKVEHEHKIRVNCTLCLRPVCVKSMRDKLLATPAPLCQKIKHRPKCEILNAVEKNTVASYFLLCIWRNVGGLG